MFKECPSGSGKLFACELRCSSARTNASSRRHKARSCGIYLSVSRLSRCGCRDMAVGPGPPLSPRRLRRVRPPGAARGVLRHGGEQRRGDPPPPRHREGAAGIDGNAPLTSPHDRHLGAPPPPVLRRPGSPCAATVRLPAPSLPSGAIGALGPVRPLSGGFGHCPFGRLRSGRRRGIRTRSERTRHRSAFLASASPAFGRDRKGLGRARDSSTLWAGPLGDSALFGRARVPHPICQVPLRAALLRTRPGSAASCPGIGQPAGNAGPVRREPSIAFGPGLGRLGTLRAPSEAVRKRSIQPREHVRKRSGELGAARQPAEKRPSDPGGPPPPPRGPVRPPKAGSAAFEGERRALDPLGRARLPPPAARLGWRTPTRRRSSWA